MANISKITIPSGITYDLKDSSVPDWAKQSNKPTYTASEVGATTTSDVNSLIASAIGDIHSFNIEVVQTLPTTDIDDHTIYFVPKGVETNNIYNEYIYVNNSWEHIGDTALTLVTYTLSRNNNIITLAGSDSSTSSVDGGLTQTEVENLIDTTINNVLGVAY